MAMTMKQLRKLADGKGLKYFLAPEGDRLMLSARGAHGLYQFLIMLQLDGQFIQFRTLSYLNCPADHQHLTPLLKTLGAINYKNRLVKYGWDESAGEVVVYADAWVMDAQLTQKQFDRLIQNYLAVIDVQHPRLTKVLDTGVDPGQQGPPGGGSLPDELQRAIRDLLARTGKGESGGEEEDGDAGDGGEDDGSGGTAGAGKKDDEFDVI